MILGAAKPWEKQLLTSPPKASVLIHFGQYFIDNKQAIQTFSGADIAPWVATNCGLYLLNNNNLSVITNAARLKYCLFYTQSLAFSRIGGMTAPFLICVVEFELGWMAGGWGNGVMICDEYLNTVYQSSDIDRNLDHTFD